MSRVIIRSVQPSGLHGFLPGQLALGDLEPGLNVIYAPNATGKSTLARAIGLLLDPALCDPDATVLGEISVGSERETRAVRRRDAPYPGFPSRPEDYLLDLVRLLQGFREKNDVQFLHRLIGSGLDLAPGSAPGWRNLAEVRRADEARSALHAARREKASVAALEDGLPGLREQRRQAEEAGGVAEALKALRQSRRLHAQHEAADEAARDLRERLPGLEQQDPGAVGTARAHEATLRQAGAAVREAYETLRRSHPRGVLPARPLSAPDAHLLGRATEALVASSARVDAETQHLRQADAEARSARETLLRLLPTESPDALPLPEAADVAALRQAASEEDAARTARTCQEGYRLAWERWRKDHPDDGMDLETAAGDLREWLAAEPLAALDPRAPVLLGISIVVALGAVLPVESVVRLVVAGAGVLAAAGVYLLMKPKPVGDRRQEIVTRLPAPLLPATTSALAMADALRGVLARKAYRDAGQALQGLAAQPLPASTWSGAAERLRLRAVDPYALAPVTAALATYLEAKRRREAHAEALGSARGQVDGARGQIEQLLRAYDYPVPPVVDAGVGITFEEWFVSARLVQLKEEAAAEHERALGEYLDLQGVPAHAELQRRLEVLREREEAVAEYRGHLESRRRAAEALQGLEIDLHRLRPVLPEPDAASDEELDRLIAEQEAAAGQREERFRAVADTEARIQAAEQSAALREKEEAFGQALVSVQDRWERVVREAVRHRLRATLTERLRREDLPPIVQRANQYLARFTSGHYQLALGTSESEGLGALCVYDTLRGQDQGFGELSTGTKVHVVLSLRLGLIEEHERAENGGSRRFPIVADEVMAVSDPEASEALASALVEVARERQVILFTNQPDDVSLFRRLLPQVRAQSLGSGISIPATDPSSAELPAYRPPRGPSRLDVRLPIRSHAPEAILPEGILPPNAGCSRVDEALAMLGEAAAEIAPLVDALEELRRELARDHPRLGWEDLAEACWVTDTFRDRIREAALRSSGCGRTFLAEVEGLKGIRAKTVGDAREWLEERGYLADPPSEEAIRRQVRLRLSRQDSPFQFEHAVHLLAAAFS